MKTNLFSRKASFNVFNSLMVALALFILCGHFNRTFAAKPTESVSVNKPKMKLGEQMLKYIHTKDFPVSGIQNGVVIVSFRMDENNMISDVVSHSKIELLDRHLKKALEGKVLRISKGEVTVNQKQYVKIRFNFDV